MILRWIGITLVFLAGCAGNTTTLSTPSEDFGQLSWPPAPDRTRINYLYSFDNFEDLGLNLPLSQRFSDFWGGKESRQMARPYAIAADDRLVVVTDPGVGAVHLFQLKLKQYQRIIKVGNKQLNSPVGAALSSDHIMVADSSLEQVFIFDRKAKLVTTISNLSRPTGVAWDETSQRIFIVETLAHRIKVYDIDGKQLMTIGNRGTGKGEFNFPTHISVKDQRILVNDTMNFRIQVFDTNGNHIRTFGRHGDASGYFSHPKGIAMDSQQNIYVASALSNRIQIFDRHGAYMMDFGGDGRSPGSFQMPTGMSIFEDRLYVSDSGNGRVQVFEYLKEE